MDMPYRLDDELLVLPSSLPTGDGRLLPTNAFLLRGAHPVLVDTGIEREGDAFLDALDTVVDPRTIRTILLTHEDADHAGALRALVERAPEARLVTTATGFGKLSAQAAFPIDRVELVRHGTVLQLGTRTVQVFVPPMYDSPATLAFHDLASRTLFTSDAFGAFVPELTERGESLPFDEVARGMSEFCRANSPWLATTDRRDFRRRLQQFASLDVAWVAPSHLPPMARRAFEPFFERATGWIDEGVIEMPELVSAAFRPSEVA